MWQRHISWHERAYQCSNYGFLLFSHNWRSSDLSVAEACMIHWHMILFIPLLTLQWTINALISALKLLPTVSPSETLPLAQLKVIRPLGYNHAAALASPVFPSLSWLLPMTAHPSQQAGAAFSPSKPFSSPPSTWLSQWPNLFLWHARGVNESSSTYIQRPDLFPD